MGFAGIGTWIERIEAKMLDEKASMVEFTDSTDFKLLEVPWIENVLIPNLPPHGMSGHVRTYIKDGDILSCRCKPEACIHGSGRMFVACLRVYD